MIRGVVFAAVMAWSIPAAGEGGFRSQRLEVAGTLQWVTHGDFDGDGRTDILGAYRQYTARGPQRYFALFYRGAQGFSPRPSHAFRAPPSAVVFDVGNVDDRPGDELLLWTRTGVFAVSFEGRNAQRPRRIVRLQGLVGAPEADDLPLWRFFRDTGPSGQPVMLLPTPDDLGVLHLRDGRWVAQDPVQLAPVETVDAESAEFRPSDDGGPPNRSYSLQVTRSVPKLTLIDQTGDGRVDLVAAFEDQLRVFVGQEDGTLAPEASYVHWFRLRTRKELENRDAFLEAQVVHMDADGIADLCLTKSSGGLTSFESRIALFKGVRGGGFEPQATQSFRHSGVATIVWFQDVDGDGTTEMVQPWAEISVLSMVRALFSRSFRLDLRLHAPSKEGGRLFEEDPIQALPMEFDLDFSSAATVRGSPPLLGRDFDGDGIYDAIVSDGGDRMRIHKGRNGPRLFREESFIGLDGDGSGTTLIIPPGAAGGRPDVLVYYVGRDDLASQMLIHVNAETTAALGVNGGSSKKASGRP